ncbi:hypothetical protein SNOUR_36205 [Streptomyces noursei ATCC 11455]|uniref:DUF2231 domain-containing protein n=1 Tax=Streptomyces noursei TaxID=1971 RepID=UPI00081C8073|nr:hypothetical protein SNOUR_36205 [Streptomyces noursei ATCC 11455]
MGPTLINGIPAHVLFVHVVVVLVPLTALALLACAVRPQLARRFGLALPALAAVTLVSVPITTHAGEWLKHHVAGDPLVRQHAELGDGLLPWTVGLFALAVALWWMQRGTKAASQADTSAVTGEVQPGTRARGALKAAAVVLSLALGAGAVVQTYRIGDSGARAAWHDNFSTARTPEAGSR